MHWLGNQEIFPKKRDVYLQKMVQTVIKPYNLNFVMKKDFIAAPLVIKEEENLNDLILEELINGGYEQDPLLKWVLQLLANETDYFQEITIADSINVDGELYYQDRFYILN